MTLETDMNARSNLSPRWTSTTKLVVASTIVVIIGALLVRFHGIIVPVMMAFILAYLMHPLASFISRRTRLSWRGAVNIIYLLLLVIILGLLTAGGVGLVQQIQSLIEVVPQYIEELPAFIENLSTQQFSLGPFHFDLGKMDLDPLAQQVLSVVQPALGKLGGLVGTLATSAATTLGWIFFILVVSYFFLAESGGLRDRIILVEIPGYNEDIKRLGSELSRIWNAFLRGQILIFLATFIVYSIVLPILGVRYAIGIALLAGFANFLPYVGPAITWVALGLVTFFQTDKLFDMSALGYTALVVVIALLIDQVFNNFVIPRVMAHTLKVHPAFVLIAALIAASLLGALGVIIAAPLLATIKLVGQYILRKMFDLDPWSKTDDESQAPSAPRWWRRLKGLWGRALHRIRKRGQG